MYVVQHVDQQSDYIKTHTDLSVGCYYGELGVDSWGKDEWNIEFEDHQVLVFTAQVFLNIVDHNYFCMNYLKKNSLLRNNLVLCFLSIQH